VDNSLYSVAKVSRVLAVDVEAWPGKLDDDALRYLPVIFNRTQAKAVGLSDRSIYWLRDEGYIVSIAPGLCRRRGWRPPDLHLAEVVVRAPKATLCLTTALSLHGLSDVFLPVADIAPSRRTCRAAGAGRHRLTKPGSG
jgi:hypothetical protein